jgi:hypothetical protein
MTSAVLLSPSPAREKGFMKTETQEPSEFQKFDTVMRKILSVSHDELKKREKAWRRKRELAKKKRAIS